MSGIEVAGLVLAVFPIVVSGLKQFKEGVETIKSWKRYQRELAKYYRVLSTQRTVFLNTIERLFDGVIQSNDELEAMMDNPEWAFSDRARHNESLKHRLGRSYDNYLDIMNSLFETLKLAGKELGIDDDGKVLWDDYSSLERQVKRLKLALSRDIYAELLEQVKESNKELKEFTKESHILESSRSRRRSQRQTIDFKLVRRHARSLYDVMVTTRSWKCHCWKYHEARLRLEPRPIAQPAEAQYYGGADLGIYQWEEDRDESNVNEKPSLKFRLLISNEQKIDNIGVSSRWQQIEVTPVDSSGSPPAELTESEFPAVSLTTLSSVQSVQPVAKKKTVKFSTDWINPPKEQICASAKVRPSTTDGSLITDICSAMHNFKGARERIGFLADESIGQYRHEIYIIDEQIQPSLSAKSLGQLLEVSQQRIPGFGLSRRDRLYIAVTLASSVLQLDGTSWLKKQWRSGDILFLPSGNQNSKISIMDYSNPYVSWKIVSDDEKAQMMADLNQAPAFRQVRNEFLFALGVTLIELSLKQNLFTMRASEDSDSSEAKTNYNTAIRLVDAVYDESGNRYGDVVQRCLTCPFNLRDLRNFGLDNDEFQEVVFNQIFTPLKEDFDDFNGKQRFR